MKEKRYPFSMKKNGHNIELAYNFLRNKLLDGEITDKEYEKFLELQETYANAISQPVYWATGKEYSILKNANMWAVSYRDHKNAQ